MIDNGFPDHGEYMPFTSEYTLPTYKLLNQYQNMAAGRACPVLSSPCRPTYLVDTGSHIGGQVICLVNSTLSVYKGKETGSVTGDHFMLYEQW